MSTGSAVPVPVRRPRARRTADQFADAAGSLGNLKVDGADLAAINRYLSTVAEMTRITKQMVTEADRAAQMPGGSGQAQYGSLGSDEIGGMAEISTRLSAIAQTVRKNLADLATAVDHTATAMTQIAHQYQNADQRNKLNAEQVQKFLNG
jgi:uncharacterized phage infection (PIP) family protein YhgE